MKVILAVTFVVAAAMAGLYIGQRKLIFPAPYAATLPAPLEDGVEIVDLPVGSALLALPTIPEAHAPLLVFAHGNAELAHWNLNSFRYFRERGVAVLLLEYPGYGGAPGQPTAESIVEAGLLAVDRVAERSDIDMDRVVVYGRSVGSGVASRIALERDVMGVVLESPFTSLTAIAAEKGFPAFLLQDELDNASALSELEVPVLLYHGTRDSIVPIAHSEALAAMAKNATLLKADCGHNDCPRPWPALMQFFESIGMFDRSSP